MNKHMKLNRLFSDEELIQMIRGKTMQSQAINQLYEQHYGMLEQMILQNSGSHDDAADMIQESMLVLVQMIIKDKFRGESSIKSILYSIAKNKWITEIRKKSSSQIRNEKFHTDAEQSTPDITEAIAKQEDLNYIIKLFDQLGETCRKILLLFYFEDYSMAEICKRLEFSSEQVLRNKKYKCLKSLNESVKASPTIQSTLQKILRNED
ncbi:MAG: sigma-70 family RNA polymerase sigma factor [Algoriphagus sp.]|uniref:RNA polymerase sigma factor n=1 Tax=Algoriphagus sp. TaxID=1872435 RepID=UPI00184C8AD4|nr:sigma-70 family RNA polymerase sigma factor [Algoriphagus sp.]NVJ87296.1 sigma-70 family RNA polymerase sigma factor [Algoriphagus sp.]